MTGRVGVRVRSLILRRARSAFFAATWRATQRLPDPAPHPGGVRRVSDNQQSHTNCFCILGGRAGPSARGLWPSGSGRRDAPAHLGVKSLIPKATGIRHTETARLPGPLAKPLNPKTAIGADEATQDREAAGDARNPRRAHECIERSPDAREVAPDRGKQARFSSLYNRNWLHKAARPDLSLSRFSA